MSHALFPYVTKVGIQAGVQSDHSFITLTLDFNKFTRGRGYWKLNNSLLKDTAYVEVVKKCLKNAAFQYSADPNIPFENIEEMTRDELQKVPVNICPKLFFEALLLDIRGETIRYASAKKRNQTKRNKWHPFWN